MTVLVFSFATATGIQIADGTWYTLAPNSLTVVMDPAFTDPVTGLSSPPSGQWVQWTDGGGQAYAAPFRAVINLKFPGTVSSGGGSGGGGG